MKKCTQCKEEKPLSCYYKNKTKTAKGIVYYLFSNCKDCHKIKTLKHSKKSWVKKKRRERLPIKQRPKKKLKTWTDIKNRMVKRTRELRQTVPHHRMKNNLYRRLHHAFDGRIASETSQNTFGCSPTALREWIESQFKDGMTWGNIEIDHMMPCSSFDLLDKDQQRQCFHYTNLQPLTKKQNRKKRNKIVHDMKWTGSEWFIKGKDGLYRPRTPKLTSVTI